MFATPFCQLTRLYFPHTHPSPPYTQHIEKWSTSKNVVVHYDLVNKIIVDCGIDEINPDHDKGKEESPKILLIPYQEYQIIIMENTSILADQSKYMDQSKGMCAKREYVRSTNKYKKGTKGGV